jgi:hypothetical protein
MDPVADAKFAISELMKSAPDGVAAELDYEDWGRRFCQALVSRLFFSIR